MIHAMRPSKPPGNEGLGQTARRQSKIVQGKRLHIMEEPTAQRLLMGGVGKRGAAQERFHVLVRCFAHSHFSDHSLLAGE